MAANEELNQLSTTDASNTPAGSDVIGATLDNELRSIKANIARSAREEVTATASAAATLAVTVLNKIVPVSGSAGGSTTITLPAAATAGAGFRFTAWKTDNTNNVIIEPDGSETVNGAANYTLATQYEAAQFVTDGTSWIVESTAKRELDYDSRYVNVSGDTMTGNLSFGDSNKAQFGAGSDLQIYHDGTDSFIKDLGTGNLYLDSDGPGFYLRVNSTQTAISALNTGEVSLRYATAEKLGTTSTGVNVTGTVTSDGADLDGAVTINEGGADVDFRVESNNNEHALFVQGSDGKVSIGGSAPTTNEVVIDDGTAYNTAISGFLPKASDALALVNATTAIPNSYTALHFHNVGNNGQAAGRIALVNQYSGQSKFAFMLRDLNGTDINEKMVIDSAGVIVNPGGTDRDFRVESDTNTHALFVQGSDGYVGINESSPAGIFHISNPSFPGTASSYPVNGDELILEGSNNVGMTIIGGDSAGARIYLGSPSKVAASSISWLPSSGELRIAADSAVDPNPQIKVKQGVQLGSPTGGFKGTGTINAVGLYGDGLEVAGDATVTGDVNITGRIGASDGGYGTSGQILSSTGTGTDWIDAVSTTQVMTFNGDSELTITPDVTDGIYRITGVLYNSVDNAVYLQTSDDGGLNYIDTAGDTANTFFRFVYGGTTNTIQSGSNLVNPGFLLDSYVSSTENEFNTFQTILAFNGVGRIATSSTGVDFNSSGDMVNFNVACMSMGNHDSGINRIRIKTPTGTLTGTVIVENLRLS